MTALLATDGVTALQRYLGVAVAAEVVDGWCCDLGAVIVAGGRLGWNLVDFAGGHFDFGLENSVCSRECDGGLRLKDWEVVTKMLMVVLKDNISRNTHKAVYFELLN